VNALIAALAAGASVAGLSIWSAAVATRALGEPRRARAHALAEIALLLSVQLACAIAAAGAAAGFAIVACAWMTLGWPFGMALNAWPASTLVWSRRGGWAALAAAVLLTVFRLAL
jgi:hypothetical protein